MAFHLSQPAVHIAEASADFASGALRALAETLPGILAPLVGIWGEFDTTAGGLANIRARRELFTQAQRGAQFHLLPGVGHWAMYEAPDEVNRLLLGSA